MADAHQYRVYCNVEEGNFDTPEGVWYGSAPTACPNCESSNIGDVVIIHSISDEDVNIKSVDADLNNGHLPMQVHDFQDLTGRNLYRKGYRFTVTAGQTYDHEISYTSNMYLQGICLRLDSNVEGGDYIVVQMVDVDGIYYPEGTVLGTFADTIYVWPERVLDCICSDAKTLYDWAYLRFRYVSTGSTNVVVMLEHVLRTYPT